MKLSAELILSAPTYINPVQERELQLRGHQIPVIENLGVAKDVNESIDLSDNGIRSLSNIPKFVRLKTLLLARNRIAHIQPDIAEAIPNLQVLILTANSVAQLADLNPLSGFSRLTHLSLVDNPVTAKEHYRLYVIWRIPSIRVLDFEKVKDKERQAARELFGESSDEPTELASQILGVKSRVFDTVTPGPKSGVTRKLSDEEKDRLRQQLKSATTLDEIDRIERALQSGYL